MSVSVKISNKRLKEEFSTNDLFIALNYVEKMAHAAQSKTSQVLEYCKKTEINPEDHLSDELRKLWEIFEEHNDMSFMIEAELDRRLKPKLKVKYGAKTIFDLNNKIDEKIRDLYADFSEKGEQKGMSYK